MDVTLPVVGTLDIAQVLRLNDQEDSHVDVERLQRGLRRWATFSLALNLVLTGVFILMVKRLLPASAATPAA